jgi:hypothetical protein
MTKEITHTPWRVGEASTSVYFKIDGSQYEAPSNSSHIYLDESKAYVEVCGENHKLVADHIVRCVNAYPELVEVLQAIANGEFDKDNAFGVLILPLTMAVLALKKAGVSNE